MNTNTMTGQPRELSDEEWCDLCLLIVDLDKTRGQLSATLLAAERPSLDEL